MPCASAYVMVLCHCILEHRIRFKTVLLWKGVWRCLNGVELKQHEFYAFLVCSNKRRPPGTQEGIKKKRMAILDFVARCSQKLENVYEKESKMLTNDDANRPSSMAIIYRSELDFMSRCILDYPNIETGGNLFGYWTQDGTPVVLYAIGPGRKAEHNTTSFAQDMDYLKGVAVELFGRYRLLHIGEWHSHHQLGLDHPSGGDTQHMKREVDNPNFPRMLLCIGTCTTQETSIKPFNFYVETGERYVPAKWDILSVDSPYRVSVDNELVSILLHPKTKEASHASSMKPGSRHSQSQKEHWLTKSVENVETMKLFVEKVRQVCGFNDVTAVMNDNGEPSISFDSERFEIKLPWGFPQKGPVLMERIEDTGGYEQKKEKIKWNYPKLSVSEAFCRWIEECIHFMPELANSDCIEESKL